MITVDRMQCIRSLLLKIVRILDRPFIGVDGAAGVHAVGINHDFFLLFFLHVFTSRFSFVREAEMMIANFLIT